MAKKEANAPEITSEKHDWGIRLKTRPFQTSPTLSAMEISADINTPKPGRGPEMRVWFSAAPVATPLRFSDINIWVSSLRSVEAEARKVGEKMQKKK